jgi:hypothetical protein
VTDVLDSHSDRTHSARQSYVDDLNLQFSQRAAALVYLILLAALFNTSVAGRSFFPFRLPVLRLNRYWVDCGNRRSKTTS